MAGAGFKTFNTGDVLTASDVNTYLMQQTTMVFDDASARSTALGANVAEGMISYLKDTNAVERYDGSSWGAIGAGDITGVTAGTGISGGGTSGDVTITNSMATAIDAKGDLIVGTGADTFSRLAVGTNDYVLTAASGEATGMKWAAAASTSSNWSLVNTGGTALSGSATVTVSGISGADKILVLISQASSGSSGQELNIRFNTDTANNYYFAAARITANSTYSTALLDQEVGTAANRITLAGMSSNAASSMSGFVLLSGGNSAGLKIFNGAAGVSAGGGNGHFSQYGGGYYNSSSTISSVSIYTGSASTYDAGTVYVYKSA